MSLLGRTAAVAAIALAGAVVWSMPAGATATTTSTVSDAVAALRAGESVYVAPDADPRMTQADADQVRAQVRESGHVYYVAVLPESAAVGGGSEATLQAIFDGVGQRGTYVLWIGDETRKAFRAGSTQVPRGTLSEATTLAFRDYGSQGPFPTITAFVDAANPLLSDAAAGGTGTGSGSSGSGSGTGWLWLLGFGAVGAGGAWWAVRKAKKANAERTAAVRRTVDEDVTSFGEEVVRLDVDDPRLDDAGRADAQRALDSYERAKGLSATMERPEDAGRVTAELEDGRFALASATARLEGRPLPERRPPCFVDPRHGPSTEDVDWAPQGGAPRPVPVCAACALTLKSGGLPQPREIEMAGGQRVPYWQGGQTYAPYAGGYYSRSADVLPMLFMGTMMASMFSPGPVIINNDPSQGGGGDGGGWGDFGGGGFGGGDFGGGGGDF